MDYSRMNKDYLKLFDYFHPYYLRTVESFEMPKSHLEAAMKVVMKNSFANSLKFVVPWDGVLYGYILNNPRIQELCKKLSIKDYGNTKFFFVDWDEFFTLTIENKEEQIEVAYNVLKSEVKKLLENCFRIPKQETKER